MKKKVLHHPEEKKMAVEYLLEDLNLCTTRQTQQHDGGDEKMHGLGRVDNLNGLLIFL